MTNEKIEELETIYDRAIKKGDEELADLVLVLICLAQDELINQ